MGKFLDISGAGNLKNIRALTLTAILVALAVVGYGLLRIEPMPGVRVSFGFVFLAVTAYMFGPAVAFPAGVIANMLAFVVFPTGAAFNPLFDLNRGIAGILYAVFLYRRNHKSEYFIIWIVMAQAAVNFICNIIINTYLLMLFGFIPANALGVITTVRIFRNITFMPVEVILLFIVLKFIAVYAQKYKFLPGRT